jgi:hypothetical protein
VNSKPLQTFAAALIALAGAAIVICIVVFGVSNEAATKRDYLEYWSAEQVLAHGGNPYDADTIFQQERQAGFDKSSVLISPSPPVALWLALPLGWVNARVGLVLWMLQLIASLLASIAILWLLMGRPKSSYHLIGIFFPPIVWCLAAGQLGIFFLLEIVLFLYFQQRSRPFLAGAALALCTLKPHLFVPFLLTLLLWSLYRRQMRALAGFAAAVAASCGLTLCLDRQIWAQYAQMIHARGLVDIYVPTAGMALRYLVNPQASWMGMLPECAGCAWAIWYFWTRRRRWDWTRQGMAALLVSIACTPYSWYTDQAMVFPALALALNASQRPMRTLLPFAAITGAGMISLIAEIPLTSSFYAWTAPAWVLWYFYAMQYGARPGQEAAGNGSIRSEAVVAGE